MLSVSFLLVPSGANGADWSFDNYVAPDGQMAPLPAVSAPNYKLRVGGGAVDSDGAFDIRGSVTVPLTFSTGLQVDGYYSALGTTDDWGAIGAHWFWRDPNIGLAGAYFEFNTLGSTQWGTFAFEGEYYLDRVTFSTVTGVQAGDVDTSFFTESGITFYPLDDLALTAAYRHDAAGSYAVAGLEYQVLPEFHGMTLFVDTDWNENGFDSVLAGLKFHFAPVAKPLIDRHRLDDPPLVGNPGPGIEEETEPGVETVVVPAGDTGGGEDEPVN